MNRTILNCIDPAGNCLQVNGVFQKFFFEAPPAFDSIESFELEGESVYSQTVFEKVIDKIKKILFFKLF